MSNAHNLLELAKIIDVVGNWGKHLAQRLHTSNEEKEGYCEATRILKCIFVESYNKAIEHSHKQGIQLSLDRRVTTLVKGLDPQDSEYWDGIRQEEDNYDVGVGNPTFKWSSISLG